MRRHHRWDDEDDGHGPDLLDPGTARAMDRAARDLRLVRWVHLALGVLGLGLVVLAAWLAAKG